MATKAELELLKKEKRFRELADKAGEISKATAFVEQAKEPADDWAISEMPRHQRALAGAGKFFTDLGRGAKDIISDTLGKDQNTEIDLSRERDAALMSDPYALGGNITAGAATLLPTMAIPGANTLAGSAMIGGGYGLSQPTGTDQSRLVNTLLGGGAGAGGYGLGKGLSYLGHQAAKPIKAGWELTKAPKTRALSKLSQALKRDEITPQQAAVAMRKMGPQSMMADAGGENVLGLADVAAQIPGKAKNRAVAALSNRQAGQHGRVIDQLTDAVGDERGFYAVLDDVTESLKTKASPLYKTAFSGNKDVASKPIDRILKTPAGRKALNGARERMQNRMAMMGKADPELSEQARFLASIDKMDVMPDGVSKGMKLRTLDFVKQELDDMIASTKKQVGTGAARRGEYADLVSLKNKLVGELDSLDKTGAYAKARAVYGGDASNREALLAGRKFIKEDAEITSRLIQKMSTSEKENFRAGAMRAIRDKIEASPDTADVYKRIFNNETMRNKLRQIFPDSKSYAAFARKMKTESTFYNTRANITGNSATAKRLAAQVDLGVDPEWMSGAVLSPQYATGRAAVRALEKQAGLPEPVVNELTKLLYSQDPAVKNKIIQELLKRPVAGGVPQPVTSRLSQTGALAGALAGPSMQ